MYERRILVKKFLAVIFALTISNAVFASEPNAEFSAGVVTGNVLSVTKGETQSEVLISDENGNQTMFFVNGATYLSDTAPADIKKGAVLTAYYDATPSKPQLAIYPPQRTALVITKGKSDASIKVGYFDANGLSRDIEPVNQLKLNVNSSVVVVDAAGNPSGEAFENKLIAVEYATTTRSIPPQTTPTKIIILEASEEKISKFASVSGTVQKITELGGVKTYLVKGDSEFTLVEKLNSYFLDGPLKTGDKITVFTEDDPGSARITASAVAKDSANRSVKTDRFDNELISYDGSLKLVLDDNTDVLLQDGSLYQETSFAGRKLAVVYGTATKSLPAVTTPQKIIVHYEDAVPLPGADKTPVSSGLRINDNAIATTSVGGAQFAALREAADALGIKLEWKADTKSVLINGLEVLQIGNETYSYNGSKKEFEAPVLIDGRTYVPVEFLDDFQ
jgi:hypothetical protein